MLPRDTIDTTVLPPGERFGMWLDLVARTSAPLRIRSAHNGDRSEILAGEFTFYDASRPHDVCRHATEPERDQATSIITMIPHAALPLPPQRMAALYGGRMSGSEGIGALLAQFLLQVTGHPEQYHAADASRLGAVGLDLATTMLGRHLVADAHHISVRSLHRLFEAEDTTVASYVRDLRLARCRRDLTDPALRSLPVQAVAARWGFPDKAHFSRAFRATYGITPQEHRDGGSDLARILNRQASTVNSLPAD